MLLMKQRNLRLKRELRDGQDCDVLKAINILGNDGSHLLQLLRRQKQPAGPNAVFLSPGMLKILGVSRSGYRAWLKHVPSNAEKRRESVKAKIKDIYDKSKQNYGAPKITQVLRKTGETISERTVGQYMKQMGIKAQWVKPWTITTRDSDFSSKLQNILDEQFDPERPNAVWCSDITYILILSILVDTFSSRILNPMLLPSGKRNIVVF